MNNSPNEPVKVPPALVRRYTIIFLLSSILGGAMVFLSVAGRRQALIDAEMARRAAAAEQAKASPAATSETPVQTEKAGPQ